MDIFQWNVTSGVQTASFSGHTNMVATMKLVLGVLYSGSVDKTIRLWNVSAKQNILVLYGKYSFLFNFW
jgi:WD40 repeat protein